MEAGFPCVDVICKFCGLLAQVKSTTATVNDRPTRALGANWAPQKEQILRDIFHALYVVSIVRGEAERIWYVPAHMLRVNPAAFRPGGITRDGSNRLRQGFSYDLRAIPDIGIERVFPSESADA